VSTLAHFMVYYAYGYLGQQVSASRLLHSTATQIASLRLKPRAAFAWTDWTRRADSNRAICQSWSPCPVVPWDRPTLCRCSNPANLRRQVSLQMRSEEVRGKVGQVCGLFAEPKPSWDRGFESPSLRHRVLFAAKSSGTTAKSAQRRGILRIWRDRRRAPRGHDVAILGIPIRRAIARSHGRQSRN